MITRVIGTARGFYDVARYLTKDRATGEDRDTGFRMGYNVSPDAMEAAQEMRAASQGRLMHTPCLHVVLAPARQDVGDPLAPADLDHMTSDLIREMGWQDYQILAVEHRDTDHQHVHLMINRAHPLEAGESIDGYYLYKDLRRWERGYAGRRQQVAHDGPSGTRLKEAPEDAVRHEGVDREPLPRQGYSGAEPAAETTRSPESPPPAGRGSRRLTDLGALSEEAGLGREVSTLAELERLAHEKEMARTMLRADAAHLKTSGRPLLSDEGQRLLRQTAREIDLILERHAPPAHRGSGMPAPEPGLEARPSDLHQRIKESYRDLLDQAKPYWMHPEGAVGDMKDLAILRGPEAVARALRHEPEAVGQRTKVPLSEADAERLAEAYRRYETCRRRYVAEVMARADLHSARALPRQGSPNHWSGAWSTEAPGSDPVARAEHLFFRDVTSRLLDARLQDVEGQLGKAAAHAARLRATVRERAYHHLFGVLQETYKDPAQAFSRLETYHRRGEAGLVARKPSLLGEMKRTRVRERVRGETPRKRVGAVVRRYGEYVDGPEVKSQLAAAGGHARRLQQQREVLTFARQRIGPPEAVRRGYGEVREQLTAGQQRRVGIRLKHLPGSEVQRRSGEILRRALRAYPGTVRLGQLKGLASQKAVDSALQKAAQGLGARMTVKQPLQFAMRAGGIATRVASAVYHGARAFFER